MRIASITVHTINLPLEAPYSWAPGMYFGATKGIVEVKTTDGIVGWGEVPAIDLVRIVEQEHAPRLIGADPCNVEACARRCLPEIRALANTHDSGAVRAFGGIELALWDIRGKALDVPVFELLGGMVRAEVAFSEYFAFRQASDAGRGEATPREVGEYCGRMREEHGSTVFEGKVGVGEPERDIELVREVRAAIGCDATLRLDANMGWSMATAQRVIRAIEEQNIANIEDPVAGFRAMAKLRRHTEIPFSTHVPDLQRAFELMVPDRIVLNLTQLGGIRETLKFISACEALGIGFWFYSGDSGIATAAYLQVSASVPFLEQPHQSLLRWYVDDVIEGGPFRPRKDVVSVPAAPGLGITVDREALKRCERRFHEEGVMAQLGDPGEREYRRLPRQ